MKVYNPLVLDILKDEPSYENDKAKWWLIYVSEDKRYSIFRVLTKETKDEIFIIIDNKINIMVGESKSLEACHVKIEMLNAYERLGGSND